MSLSQDYSLPYEAIPKLISLMRVFKKTLNEQCLSFIEFPDLQYLKIVIDVLQGDLKIFSDNFENWYQNAETSEEIQMLEALAKELGEAQNLISQATTILSRYTK